MPSPTLIKIDRRRRTALGEAAHTTQTSHSQQLAGSAPPWAGGVGCGGVGGARSGVGVGGRGRIFPSLSIDHLWIGSVFPCPPGTCEGMYENSCEAPSEFPPRMHVL